MTVEKKLSRHSHAKRILKGKRKYKRGHGPDAKERRGVSLYLIERALKDEARKQRARDVAADRRRISIQRMLRGY
jgi:hypothetical protein